MIRPEKWMDIKLLRSNGLSKREIARITGHSRNTIDKLLNQSAPEPFQRRPRRSLLDPYKEYIKARWNEFGLSALRLFEEVQPQGYTGCLNLVERYVKTLKDEKAVAEKATVRFETPPGQQAQADWAHVGEDDGVKIYAFIMVLGFSRTAYVDFTKSMAIPTLIECHQDAFVYFGGVPRTILYDNMAQVRLPSGELNPHIADYAAHHGFAVRTHRVRRPRTKGKVERLVDYIKDNFLNGRSFAGFDDLRTQGKLWAEHANCRIHGTTGKRPCDLLPLENLTPLDPSRPYKLARRYDRIVDAEGFVRLNRTRYSVPPEYVDKSVIVVEADRSIRVLQGDRIVAEHPMGRPGECVAAREHVEAMWKQTIQKAGATPVPHVEFTRSDVVVCTPLSKYEEAAG